MNKYKILHIYKLKFKFKFLFSKQNLFEQKPELLFCHPSFQIYFRDTQTFWDTQVYYIKEF